MDEEQEPPPLVYASVTALDGAWRVDMAHPEYGGGVTVQLTQYSDEQAANDGARWWEGRITGETPPNELVCMTGARYERSQA
jgi:hypothetical protein